MLLTFIIAVRESAEDFKKALKNKYDFDLFSLQNIFIEYQDFMYFFSICRIDIDAKEDKKMEADEKFWEVLMSAEKKDYESICVQYGVTDFRGMLKKLNEKKIEREKEQEKVLFPHLFFKEYRVNYI